MSTEEAQIRDAQAALEAARALLLAPSVESVDGSVPHLERAVACLDAIQSGLRARPAGPAVRAGMRKLRQMVRRVTALLENAAEFHLGASQLLAVALAGYTARGEPGQPQSSGTIRMEG
jgi:hypothetical protein